MAKTLLEIVQGILSEMDSDEVNSINDTVESRQVAEIVGTVFENMMNDRNWPHTRRALVVEPRSDTDFPTHFRIKDSLKELCMISYDCRKVGIDKRAYKEIIWKDPDDFCRYLNKRDNTKATTDIVIDDSGIELLINNDTAPKYYTSLDDYNLIFDSYDSAVDTTLQQSKFQASGYVMLDFLLEDAHIPDLPIEAQSKLIEESTTRAQYKLRQFSDQVSAAESRRQEIKLSRNAWRVNGGIKFPDYGRK